MAGIEIYGRRGDEYGWNGCHAQLGAARYAGICTVRYTDIYRKLGTVVENIEKFEMNCKCIKPIFTEKKTYMFKGVSSSSSL